MAPTRLNLAQLAPTSLTWPFAWLILAQLGPNLVIFWLNLAQPGLNVIYLAPTWLNLVTWPQLGSNLAPTWLNLVQLGSLKQRATKLEGIFSKTLADILPASSDLAEVPGSTVATGTQHILPKRFWRTEGSEEEA